MADATEDDLILMAELCRARLERLEELEYEDYDYADRAEYADAVANELLMEERAIATKAELALAKIKKKKEKRQKAVAEAAAEKKAREEEATCRRAEEEAQRQAAAQLAIEQKKAAAEARQAAKEAALTQRREEIERAIAESERQAIALRIHRDEERERRAAAAHHVVTQPVNNRPLFLQRIAAAHAEKPAAPPAFLQKLGQPRHGGLAKISAPSARAQDWEDMCTCSVCLERVVDRSLDPCGHAFCIECIASMRHAQEGGMTCPVCREPSGGEHIIRL